MNKPIKKILRISLIILASLLMLLIISAGLLSWYIFVPEKLTRIVNNQTEKYIPYETVIGEVELTVFSTFPRLGVRISNFHVISPVSGSQCDTLLRAGELTGVIDSKAYREKGDIVINSFILSDAYVNVFVDSLGWSNFDLFIREARAPVDEKAEVEPFFIDLQNIEFNNLDLVYSDQKARIDLGMKEVNGKMAGNVKGDLLSGNIVLNNSLASFEFAGDKYLDNYHLELNVTAGADLSRQLFSFDNSFLSLNGLDIGINGSVENDTGRGSILTNIDYEFNSLKVEDIMAIIPLRYISAFGEIDVTGLVSSSGIIKGEISDTLLPLIDLNMTLANGNFIYDFLPYPLGGINWDVDFIWDMNSNDESSLHVNTLVLNTPDSELSATGKVDNLFGDMHYDLIADLDLKLEELMHFIPEAIDMDLSGRVGGELKSDFSLSQALTFDIGKMKLSGSLILSEFSMIYDTLTVNSTGTGIDFALPNTTSSGNNRDFASARISSDSLEIYINDHISTLIKSSHFYVEMSDIRDTTARPSLHCRFNIEKMMAGNDTANISVNRPYGYFTYSPGSDDPGQPDIELAYTSFDFEAQSGSDFARAASMTLNAGIQNDKTSENIFLQWLAEGNIEMTDGFVSLSVMASPLEIPSIIMDFDPETFNIRESNVRIDRSDFSLTGSWENVFSYFRGDSVLKGDFSFLSDNTDIVQLMNLTSGIGIENDTPGDPSAYNNNNNVYDTTFTGPYMVPQGIDLLLRANVKQALMHGDTISDIRGDVRVNDGILVLDGLSFTTPAADMRLTAMYRTPRKNHLYLGIDYHMLDVEIETLLNMIPDIDTLMPMLRSFRGTGEFHIAVETYLDSLYNIKMSTLRGASSIRGQDLVLLDGETFSEIARTLRFSRRAENRVDSLSAEFTIFREEIDVYPFLIVMDRYQAVVGGRHNLDMSFDYHISLVDSPLPFRLGIDIGGNLDKLQYRVVRPKYADLYRPASRRVVESRQLELRRMIYETLTRGLMETE